jgi:phospholipid/cholesterol/gamma-HCH transport system substrate-binding protein
MDDRVLHFRVGLMTVASVLIAVILVLFFGEIPLWEKTYLLRIRFDRAPGVSADTPVRKSGILIGRVVRHEFDKEGKVIVTVRIHEAVPLKQNEVCRIRGSLLGDAVLEFVPSGDPRKPDAPIQREELQEGVVAIEPLEAVADMRTDLKRAIDSIVSTSEKFGQTVQRVDGILKQNEDRINRMITMADRSLSLSQTTFENLNRMIGDDQSRQQLARAIQQLPDLITSTQQAVQQLDLVLRDVQSFSRPLRERGPALAENLDQSLSKLNATLDQMYLFAQALNNNTGTLGQLVHNRELYDRLRTTIANLEEVSERLRPIVEDARIFADKVARHPGILVRDAVRPQAGLKGVPAMTPEELAPYQFQTPGINRPGLLAPLFQPR